MPSIVDRVLPYLKASVEDRPGQWELQLSANDTPVLDPYVGELLISYIVDEGSHFRLIAERERRASGLSAEEFHENAKANLTRKIEGAGVRLARNGNYLAVLFDGNLEATLLLWDALWPHVHAQLGPELVAVAPARDILAVSSPAGLNELRDVIAGVWPNGDHLLTREIYQRCVPIRGGEVVRLIIKADRPALARSTFRGRSLEGTCAGLAERRCWPGSRPCRKRRSADMARIAACIKAGLRAPASLPNH